MIYSDLTRRYFERADGAGVLAGPGVARGAAGSRAAGTWVQFDLAAAWGGAPATVSTIGAADSGALDSGATDSGDASRPKVAAARFLAFGCPHTIAVASWVVERSVGAELTRALPESVQSIARRFDLPTGKLGRLLVVEDAWAAAAAAILAAAVTAVPARIAT